MCRTHPSRGTPWQGHGADETPGLVTGPRPRRERSGRGPARPAPACGFTAFQHYRLAALLEGGCRTSSAGQMDLPVAGSECPNGKLRTTSQSEGRRTWVRRGITLLYARRSRQYLDVRPNGVAAIAEKQTSSRCRHNRLSTARRCRGALTHRHGDLGAAARADIRRWVAHIERRRGRYSRCDRSLGGFATRDFPSRCVIPRANTRLRAPKRQIRCEPAARRDG